VPNKPSAKKSLRQNKKRRARNIRRKTDIKDSVKQLDKSLEDNDPAAVEKALRICFKSLDKAAAKGVIHKNKASRRKSRLAARTNKILN